MWLQFVCERIECEQVVNDSGAGCTRRGMREKYGLRACEKFWEHKFWVGSAEWGRAMVFLRWTRWSLVPSRRQFIFGTCEWRQRADSVRRVSDCIACLFFSTRFSASLKGFFFYYFGTTRLFDFYMDELDEPNIFRHELQWQVLDDL